MTGSTARTLCRLADTGLAPADAAADVRGLVVLDAAGHVVGEVSDLLVDPAERKVRVLRVGAGDFLGLGPTEYLIPVDLVTRVSDETVHISPVRDDLIRTLSFDPGTADAEHLGDLARYYGHPPYWEAGYRYPRLPRFV